MMNRILLEESIFEVFQYANEKLKDIAQVFPTLLKDYEFILLLQNRPHDIAVIKFLIRDSKHNILKPYSINKIRYASYLISKFITDTDNSLRELNKYIDLKYVFTNFDYLHTKDIDEVIFELINIRLSKVKNRGKKYYMSNDNSVAEKLYKLYKIKSFKTYIKVFDSKINREVCYFSNTKCGIKIKNINEIEDPYIINRYLLGSVCYLFINQESILDITSVKSALLIYVVNDKYIKLMIPGKEDCFFYFV